MNTNDPVTDHQTARVYTEQPESVLKAEKEDLTTNFFVVGGVINILMITAYFIWAFRAWKKTDKRGGR